MSLQKPTLTFQLGRPAVPVDLPFLSGMKSYPANEKEKI